MHSKVPINEEIQILIKLKAKTHFSIIIIHIVMSLFTTYNILSQNTNINYVQLTL